jgi:uncharacterized protein
MSIAENKRIASEFIAASGCGDFSLLDDSATFFVAGDLPGCGMLAKKDLISLRDGFLDLGEGEFKIEATSLIAEGDWVAAEAVGYLKLKNGKIYNNHYHLAFQIRDGKIITAREYSDTDHLRQTFFAG